MGKPKAPTPPDPRDTSAAQTGTNIATALANTATGNVNQVTPYGNLTYDQTGTYSFTDPYTGQSYDLPQYTATTTLNPQQQETLAASQAAQGNLADVAQERSGFLKDYLPNATPEAIDAKLYDLGAQRLDPRFAREEDALRTRLANQGLAPNSEAYAREMDRFTQGKNDAYNSLVLGGRGQALAEINQPINQITALLSGSQVANPNVAMNQPARVATTDNAALINNAYNQQYQNYQTRLQNRNDLLGGLFGLASGGLAGGYF